MREKAPAAPRINRLSKRFEGRFSLFFSRQAAAASQPSPLSLGSFSSRFSQFTHPGVWRASSSARLELAIRDGASSEGAEEARGGAATAVAAAVEINDDDDEDARGAMADLDAALLAVIIAAAGLAMGVERRIVRVGTAAEKKLEKAERQEKSEKRKD